MTRQGAAVSTETLLQKSARWADPYSCLYKYGQLFFSILANFLIELYQWSCIVEFY